MAVEAPISLVSGSKSSRTQSKLAAFQGSFRLAAKRVRIERALSFAVASLVLPVLLSAAWVILVRFTLLDLPQWPALLPLVIWVGVLLAIVSRTRVSTGQAARYLDHALSLDERLATYVELTSRRHSHNHSSAMGTLADALGKSILPAMRARRGRLPGIRVRANRVQLVGMGLATCLLALVIMSPTPLDAIRLERQRLAQSISTQLQRIADLRADFVTRPQISDSTRSALLAELDRLTAELKTPGVDQAAVLAAISDTQERLRQLSPDLSSDFDPLIRAAQTIQEAVLHNSSWSKTTAKATTDLGLAAEAVEYLSSYVLTEDVVQAATLAFKPANQVSASRSFESASGLAAQRDGALAKMLQDTSSALREKSLTHASQLLATLGPELRRVEGQQQAADAVEHALSSLDDSKQSIAQTTEVKQKKAQVGFRRGQVGSASTTATAAAAVSQGQKPSISGTPGKGDQSGPSSQGGDPTRTGMQPNPGLGPNMPGGPNPGTTQGQQPDTQGGSSSQPGDGKGDGNSKSGSTGGLPSSSGGTPQPGQSDGKLSGPVTGPGGNVTGGITKVENPEGVGISQGDGSSPKQTVGPQDNITIPLEGNSTVGDSGGTGSVPTPGVKPQGPDSGEIGTGAPTDGKGQTSGGSLTTVHTPFTEVIGQYAQRAAEALDRAYIPQDAKEYVRQYFTELGK